MQLVPHIRPVYVLPFISYIHVVITFSSISLRSYEWLKNKYSKRNKGKGSGYKHCQLSVGDSWGKTRFDDSQKRNIVHTSPQRRSVSGVIIHFYTIDIIMVLFSLYWCLNYYFIFCSFLQFDWSIPRWVKFGLTCLGGKFEIY